MRDIESGHAYTVSSVSHYIWLSFQLVSLGVQYASRYFALFHLSTSQGEVSQTLVMPRGTPSARKGPVHPWVMGGEV